MSQTAVSSISSLPDSSTQELLQKIHEEGYWRVIIRPTEFSPTRIPSLSRCREIVRASVVRLRGWDYPHWDDAKIRNMQDWIEGDENEDWNHHIEYWRYYQSGQFVHHFNMREDCDVGHGEEKLTPRSPSKERFLDIMSSLYTITEIYEFAARLAYQGALSPGAEVMLSLNRTQGRVLKWAYRQNISWGKYGNYVSCTEPITWQHDCSAKDLLACSADLALDAAVGVFERFNWSTPPRDLLAEDQRKFIERRL